MILSLPNPSQLSGSTDNISERVGSDLFALDLAIGKICNSPDVAASSRTVSQILPLYTRRPDRKDYMSLSFRRRDRDGNVHHYFIPFDPMVVIMLVVVSMVFALSTWFAFRALVYESPHLVVSAILLALALGFTSFAIAKFSVIRKGKLVSFGPKRMTSTMRHCYIAGYFVIGCACLLAALFAVVAMAAMAF